MAELDVKIRDGMGLTSVLEVTEYNAANTHVIIAPLSPSGTAPRRRPFTEKVDIHNGGTDGSTTPVTYELLAADPTNQFSYFIQTITLVVTDGSINNNRYGAINGLSNGIDLFTEIQGATDYLAQGVTTNGELLLWAAAGGTLPSDPGVISSYTANNSALVAIFDCNEQIPPAGGLAGIEINRGTFDHLSITINDNLNALTDHFVFVKGFKLYD